MLVSAVTRTGCSAVAAASLGSHVGDQLVDVTFGDSQLLGVALTEFHQVVQPAFMHKHRDGLISEFIRRLAQRLSGLEQFREASFGQVDAFCAHRSRFIVPSVCRR